VLEEGLEGRHFVLAAFSFFVSSFLGVAMVEVGDQTDKTAWGDEWG